MLTQRRIQNPVNIYDEKPLLAIFAKSFIVDI